MNGVRNSGERKSSRRRFDAHQDKCLEGLGRDVLELDERVRLVAAVHVVHLEVICQAHENVSDKLDHRIFRTPGLQAAEEFLHVEKERRGDESRKETPSIVLFRVAPC